MAIITQKFAVTLPTEVPKAISGIPCAEAKIETKISGNVVATLTSVAPIINLGILATVAIRVALSTKTSLPFTVKRSPVANKTTANAIDNFATTFTHK